MICHHGYLANNCITCQATKEVVALRDKVAVLEGERDQARAVAESMQQNYDQASHQHYESMRECIALKARVKELEGKLDELHCKWENANILPTDVDPRVQIYERDGYFGCKWDGGDTAPFKTKREALAWAEGFLDLGDATKELVAAKDRVKELEDAESKLKQLRAGVNAVISAIRKQAERNKDGK